MENFTDIGDISQNTIGFVLDNNTVQRPEIKAYVPKLMVNMKTYTGVKTKLRKYSDSFVINKKKPTSGTNGYTECNYICLLPEIELGREHPKTPKGKHIKVYFVDNNLSKGRFTEEDTQDTQEASSTYNNKRQRHYIDSSALDEWQDDPITRSKIAKGKKVNPPHHSVSHPSSDPVETSTSKKLRKTKASKFNKRSKSANSKSLFSVAEKTTFKSAGSSRKDASREYDFFMDSDNPNQKMGMRLGVLAKSANDRCSEDYLVGVILLRDRQSVKIHNKKSYALLDGLDWIIFSDQGLIKLDNKELSLLMDDKHYLLDNKKLQQEITEEEYFEMRDDLGAKMTFKDTITHTSAQGSNITMNESISETSSQGSNITIAAPISLSSSLQSSIVMTGDIAFSGGGEQETFSNIIKRIKKLESYH